MAWPGIMGMSQESFVNTFGGIYEHSAWLAEAVFKQGLRSEDDNPESLHRRMSDLLSASSTQAKLELIRAHPDLAGRAALANQLTEDSTAEQHAAGLDQCSAEELEKFNRLNAAYLDKFGFPFIIAVKGLNRSRILEAFERRIHHSPKTEFECALQEINRIARLRLEAL
jgi:OHCU decarboxylase